MDTPSRSRRSGPPIRATVHQVHRLTPHLVRVVLAGDELAAFGAGAYTDHYVKLQLPPPGADYRAPFDAELIRETRPRDQWPRTRTYTVRAWEPARGTLTIDFVVHGDEGVAGPWAESAQPGDILQLSQPGGAYSPDPDADWHLLVGDLSVVPAISASLERIPPGVPVHVIIEVDGPDDEVELASPGDLRVQWQHNPGAIPTFSRGP